jgi:hypothetical protein
VARAVNGPRRGAEGAVKTVGFAPRLSLAATPAFALMALLTAALPGRPMEGLCAAGRMSLLGGMVPMYLLMSAFHSAPWLQLVRGHVVIKNARRGDDSRPPLQSHL